MDTSTFCNRFTGREMTPFKVNLRHGHMGPLGVFTTTATQANKVELDTVIVPLGNSYGLIGMYFLCASTMDSTMDRMGEVCGG